MNARQQDATTSTREDLGIEAELRRARILLEVAERCASINDLDGVLHELVVLTSRALECDRGTLFLNDTATGELFSRVAEGNLKREIRILNSTGFAGHVFQTGVGLVIDDPYNDPRFNASVDERTGYRTESVVCAPVRTMTGDLIGVMQSLNKLPHAGGKFTPLDLRTANRHDPAGGDRAAKPPERRAHRQAARQGNGVHRAGLGH
jgi:adenylate cyclase